MIRRTRRTLAIGVALLLASGTAVASPAYATVSPQAFTSASGSKTCPEGQYVYVQVYATPKGDVKYYQGSTLRRTAYGVNTDIYYYGVKTANWRVTTTTNFETVSDGCSRTRA